MRGHIRIILGLATVLDWLVVGLGVMASWCSRRLDTLKANIRWLDDCAWSLWERHAANMPRLWLVSGGQTLKDLRRAEIAIREHYLLQTGRWRCLTSHDGMLRRYFWRGRCIAEVMPHPSGWDAWQARLAELDAMEDESGERIFCPPGVESYAHQVFFPEEHRKNRKAVV